MHFNLEEQEQIADIKAWWKQYGLWIIGGIVAVALAYVIYAGWNWYSAKQSQAASQLYETMMTAAQKQDSSQVLRAADDIENQYASTAYAGMAGLIAAQAANAAGDIATAEKHLRFTMDKAKSSGHSELARARLISLLIDKADFEGAKKLAEAKVSDAFKPLMLERQGDIFLAQEQATQARTYYQQAWDLLIKNPEALDESKRLLKVKLDAVGGR